MLGRASTIRCFLMLLGLILDLALAPAPSASQTDDSLLSQIVVLRARAEYLQAIPLAQELLKIRSADPKARAWEISDTERLLATLQVAASLSKDKQEKLAVADSLELVIESLFMGAEYESGVAAAERQFDIRMSVLGETHAEVAQSLNSLGAILGFVGEHERSMQLLKQGLSIRRELLGEDHPDVAETLTNLANISSQSGDYRTAAIHCEEALDIFRRALGNYDLRVGVCLSTLGVLQCEEGDYAAAEQLHREALAIYRGLNDEEDPYFILELNNLASVLQERGDYLGAEALYRKSIVLGQKAFGFDHPWVATTLDNISTMLQGRGDFAEAEPLSREALSIRKSSLGPDHPDVAMSHNNLGVIQSKTDHLVDAEQHYREALAIFERIQGENHPDILRTRENLAAVLAARNRSSAAEAILRDLLSIRLETQGANHPDVSSAMNNLADVLKDGGDWNEAENLYREALALREKMLGKMHPDVRLSLLRLATLVEARGNHLEAETLLARAAKIFESARLLAGIGYSRATFEASPYEILAAARLHLGKPDEAWTAWERSRGRVLSDLLARSGSRSLSPKEKAREDSLARALSDWESLLDATPADKIVRGDEDSRLYQDLRIRCFEAQAEWSHLQKEMASKYPVTEGEPYPLTRVQAALPPGCAIVGWLDVVGSGGRLESWGYVLRDRGPVHWTSLVPENADTSSLRPLRQFRSTIHSLASSPLRARMSDEMIDLAHKIWTDRIDPLTSSLIGVEELVVIPSASMLGVPIEALVDSKGRFVGDLWDVSYIPSATIYAWLQERSPVENATYRRALVLGDPPFLSDEIAIADLPHDPKTVWIGGGSSSQEDASSGRLTRSVLAGNREAIASLDPLPGTRNEVYTIASLMPDPEILVGREASEQALAGLAESGELKSFDVIHLATHALIDWERVDRSAMVLSQTDLPDPAEAAMAGERTYDGLLSAKEIVQEWDLSADLVTLSACETALGREVRGEGYVGFVHAFLQAGARSLLVSLWKVEDEATVPLMRRFYENRLGKYGDERFGKVGEVMSKAEALQEARKWLRAYTDERGRHPYEHPYYWSAFILIGDRGHTLSSSLVGP